jgi:hypothetical protein
MIMGPILDKHKRLSCLDFSVCAQIVSKNHQEYQNVSKDIELYRNPECPKTGIYSGELIYFLYVSFFRRFLHTIEVRGSSPLSPTIQTLYYLRVAKHPSLPR